VRRAGSLQVTADAKRQAAVNLSATDAERLGVADGSYIRVHQGDHVAVLPVRVDPGVVDGTVFIAAGIEATAMLGPRISKVDLVKAEGHE